MTSTPHSSQQAFQVIRECLAQGERAMDELGWTRRNVMVQATLACLEEQLEALRAVMRGIAHADPPAKGTPAEELARELAAVRLAARVALDEWGSNPASRQDA